MSSGKHALLGAAVAVLPDAALALFGWRRRWLEPDHPLVRLHRWLHSANGAWLIIIGAWASHLVADSWTSHREGPS
jgi:hypothetical protein